MKLRVAPLVAAFVCVARISRADDAPANGAPVPLPPPPTVVADGSAPLSCQQAYLRCDEVDADPGHPADIGSAANAALPGMRELRKCLDAIGGAKVAATARVHGGTTPEVETLVAGADGNPCMMQSRALLASVAAATPGTMECTYECIAPPVVAPVVVAPPVIAPVAPLPLNTTEQAAPSVRGDRWYGWQTIIADAASAAVLAGGVLAWKVEPTAIGYGGFVLATPILHAVHGNVGRMFASLALRILVPTLAGGIGAGASLLANKGDSTEKGIVKSAGIGAAIGAGGCILIDLGALAWEKRAATSSGRAANGGGAF